MKAFEWVSPATVEEAVSLLKSAPASRDMDEAARPLAGGQDLLTTMKDYLTRPVRVVVIPGMTTLSASAAAKTSVHGTEPNFGRPERVSRR